MTMEPTPGHSPTGHEAGPGKNMNELKRIEHRLPFPGATAIPRAFQGFDPNARFARLQPGRAFTSNQAAREHARGRHSR